MPGKEYSSECWCVTCDYYRGTKETTLLGTGVILLKTVTPDTDTRIPLTIKGEYGEAVIDLVVWVTGINYHTNTEDSAVHSDHYSLSKSLENISDVGCLTVQVVQAMGLGSKELQGNILLRAECSSFIFVWINSNFAFLNDLICAVTK